MQQKEYAFPINEPMVIFSKTQKARSGIFIETLDVISNPNKVEISGWIFGGNITEILDDVDSHSTLRTSNNRTDVRGFFNINDEINCESFNIVVHYDVIPSVYKFSFIGDFNGLGQGIVFNHQYIINNASSIGTIPSEFLSPICSIEVINEREISGIVTFKYPYKSKLKCSLVFNGILIAKTYGSLSNFNVDKLKSEPTYCFKFKLGRIDLNQVRDADQEIKNTLEVFFSMMATSYKFNVDEVDFFRKTLKLSKEILLIERRGEIEIKDEICKKIDKERRLSFRPTTKLIAFYLPQFHIIPENNQWWGDGFTEWTNVTQARPAFNGHKQPKTPGALGYYDASQPQTLERQIGLAEKYGLEAFCFYYYWFNGKRLLSKPLDEFVKLDHNFKFMICWANENWTRSWDGLNHDILLKNDQTFDNDVHFVEDILPLLLDSRYLTQNDGAKWLAVYRESNIESPDLLFAAWKAIAAENGIKLHISTIDGFGQINNVNSAVDSYIQFPPLTASIDRINDRYLINSGYENVSIYSYEDLMDASLSVFNNSLSNANSKKLYPGVTPGWDNSARKKGNAHIMTGESPRVFGAWVEKCCSIQNKIRDNNDRFLFINAWNEWAEGAFLEPDKFDGERKLIELIQGVNRADLTRDQNTSNDNSNLFIKNLKRSGKFNSFTGLFNVNIFSNYIPYAIRNSSLVQSDIEFLFNVEKINGKEKKTQEVYFLKKENGISIDGWVGASVEFVRTHPVYFCLRDENFEAFWSISSDTYIRDDVTDFYKNSKPHLNAFGFDFSGIFDEKIDRGRYSLTGNVIISNSVNYENNCIQFHICTVELI